MQAHHFEVGQNVELIAGYLTPRDALGQYTITRLMPNDGADREYRVKNDRDGHERVVRQSQMRPGRFAVLGKNVPLAD
ncbi:hypothetical protein [Roseomonas chloroacetimidivorans]|jgi:hypothetical protein|uniref:hypothetical protein n=1 Tax=Roseomonas chloroacetimidivorans TaxID=1766656 RepID=UPI003C76A26D